MVLAHGFADDLADGRRGDRLEYGSWNTICIRGRILRSSSLLSAKIS